MMLYGLALENLLKGLLVSKGVNATVTGRLDRALKTHNLRELCSSGGVYLNEEESQFLDSLQTIVESSKYPFGGRPRKSGVEGSVRIPKDINLVLELIDRVETILVETA